MRDQIVMAKKTREKKDAKKQLKVEISADLLQRLKKTAGIYGWKLNRLVAAAIEIALATDKESLGLVYMNPSQPSAKKVVMQASPTEVTRRIRRSLRATSKKKVHQK